MTDVLDEIRNVRPRKGSCQFCDDPATTSVEIRVRERGGGREVVSAKTVGVCAPHAVKLYRKVEAIFNKRAI